MNPLTSKEAVKLFSDTAKNIPTLKKTSVVACPPFSYLPSFAKASAGAGKTKKIILGAQDAFWEESGPYTGEVSAQMLYNMGVRYVILGHSERRALGETNDVVNKKIKGSLAASLTPILCVGESERDVSHNYFNLVKNQVEECLAGVSKSLVSKVIIAYEPVWAISTTLGRRDASPADSLEMVIFIRKVLSDKFGPESANVKIIYGGSVNEKDAGAFLKDGGVEGLLVGRASLDPKKFSEIISITENL